MADLIPTDDKTMKLPSQKAAIDAPAATAPTAESPAAPLIVAATAVAKSVAKTAASALSADSGELPVKRGRGRPPKSAAEKAATVARRKLLRKAKTSAVRQTTTPVRKKSIVANAGRPASISRTASTGRPASRPAPQFPLPKIERNSTVNLDPNTLFPGFAALPGSERFQAMFSQVNAKSQEAVAKSSQIAEDLVGITKGNVEALVTSSRIAASGAQAIGQEAVELGKQGLEEASAAIKGFAAAKSPTELFQLQTDYARSAFDQMVSNSSKMTESLVKFAGEAFAPLSTRVSVNTERFNSIVA